MIGLSNYILTQKPFYYFYPYQFIIKIIFYQN